MAPLPLPPPPLLLLLLLALLTGGASGGRVERALTTAQLVARVARSTAAGVAAGAPPDFECAWRALAFRYAQRLQPWRPPAAWADIHDALELDMLCNQTAPPRDPPQGAPPPPPPPPPPPGALYVDPVSGSDANAGTQAAPLLHVALAVRLARALPPPATVVLRAGVHRLAETLELGAADAGLTLMAFPGEAPVLSGGAPLTPTWAPFNVSGGNGSTWVVLNASNNMYGQWPDRKQPPTLFNASSAPSAQACEGVCASFPGGGCRSFVWYDPRVFPARDWAGRCFVRTDAVWGPVTQAGVWSGYAQRVDRNVWVAGGAAAGVPAAWRDAPDALVPGLLHSPDGGASPRRATRARFPDADPETALFPTGWSLAGTYQPGALDMNTTVTSVPLPGNYPGPGGSFPPAMFTDFALGQGGPCSRFTPPVSVWCQPGGRTQGAQYFINSPAGFVHAGGALPHAPYASNVTRGGARFVWWRPHHWYTQAARVSGYTPANETLTFGYGAFHGCEGSADGEGWFLEQVAEELDAPNEFYYDPSADALLYFHNATPGTPPPAAWTWEAPALATLVRVAGTPDAPAVGVTLAGLTFTAAAASLMLPHETPSGGDWAVSRVGAVQLEGTVNATVVGCTFRRVDGNALVLSGFNRGAAVDRSEFVWVGESAILSVGDAAGADATAGGQPWGTRVTGCLCHEIGHFQKQASCYFQALTSGSLVSDSIFFNGPRAMINFNDGMPGRAGSSVVQSTLIFNSCRESQDHGPFNSWDRLGYWGYNQAGELTLFQDYHVIRSNLFVANYGANSGAVDNDDGSSRYNITGNFLVYGGHKNNFYGRQKMSIGNVMAFAGVYGPRCSYFSDLPVLNSDPHGVSYNEVYVGNVCVLGDGGDEYVRVNKGCDPKNATPPFTLTLRDNRVYAPGGNVTVACGTARLSLAAWLATGLDANTTAAEVPPTATIIGWGAALLGL